MSRDRAEEHDMVELLVSDPSTDRESAATVSQQRPWIYPHPDAQTYVERELH